MVAARKEKRRYRKVLCRIYSDDKFMELTRPQPNGQTLWLYLLTGPHTRSVPGLFTAGEASLAEALDWPLAGFRRAWREIADRQMAKADWKARVVWLPNAFAHNQPENPNVVRGWRQPLEEVPACDLKTEAIHTLKALVAQMDETEDQTFVAAFEGLFLKPFGKGLRNQETGTGTGAGTKAEESGSVIRGM